MVTAASKKAGKPAIYKKNVKLTKKWMSKMRKKGKVRRSDLSKFKKYSKLKDDDVDEKSSKLTDDLEALRAQEAQFYDQLAENFGFVDESSSSDDDMSPPSKKSKTTPKIKEEPKSDDEQTDAHPLLEVRYARSNFVTADESNDDKSNLKHLLPIKNAAGKILQVVRKVETEDDQANVSEIEQDGAVEEKTTDNEPISTSKLFADRAQLLDYYKRNIAAKASAIIANPQQNVRRIHESFELQNDSEIGVSALISFL
uniref:Nucleolar protein 16 n=1 Tax=Romanomermis culicivorax TaxID=13658 RepID=A0A915J7Y6_ROMCU